MQSQAKSVNEYLSEIPEDRKASMLKLQQMMADNLPPGFEEQMAYGMITYCIPHTTYPAGYHCNPKQALPFISIASQKNFIAIYHMGIYAMPDLLNWFVEEFPKYSKKKLDMGKSCMRFKKAEDIPFDLLASLMQKVSVQDWIACYEKNYLK